MTCPQVRVVFILISATLATQFSMALAAELGTAFTYQGELKKDGVAVADPACEFKVSLWDSGLACVGGVNEGQACLMNAECEGGVCCCPGTQYGGYQTETAEVNDGLFVISPDFGPGAIDGTARWLQIEVRCSGDALFTPLKPRVKLSPTPHALALPGLYTQQNAISPNVIGGYYGNTVTGHGGTIGGGGKADEGMGSLDNNRVTGSFGTVGGGQGNEAGPSWWAVVGGGSNNHASGLDSVVGGGLQNQSSGASSVVAGGGGNSSTGDVSAVGGGGWNNCSGDYTTIAGGHWNAITANFGVIAGGGPYDLNDRQNTSNKITDDYGTICGGGGNRVGSDDGSTTNAPYATVGGGYSNIARGRASVISGGASNYTGPVCDGPVVGVPCLSDSDCPLGSCPSWVEYATVGGGEANIAGGNRSAIGGGTNNKTRENYATVGGGADNVASGPSSTVPGGASNEASGTLSFAAGNRAKARDYGTFVWADSSVAADFASTGMNQFLIRASGGVGIGTNAPSTRLHVDGGTDVGLSGGGYFVVGDTAATNITLDNNEIMARNAGATSTLFLQGDGGNVAIGQNTFNSRLAVNLFTPLHPIHVGNGPTNGNGAHLTAGGVWTNGSDRNTKESFEALDKQEVLRRVAALSVTRWKYKGESDAVRHIGPMAQDFYAAFATGQDERCIGTVDADGVALAAIQGLNETDQEMECQLEELLEMSRTDRQRADKLEWRNRELEARLDRLESLLITDPKNKGK